jgi:myosin-crossreactive antigen
MSEDADFNIEQWREDFDRDMAVYKAAVKSLQEFRKQPVIRLTAEDCVFMRQCGIKVD